MSLFTAFSRRNAQADRRDRNRRRAFVAMETLEDRKVLSVTYGSFAGMPWKFDYNPTQKTGTLVFDNQPGNSRIYLNNQYDNNDDNPQINGITWSKQGSNLQGGIDFDRGAHLQIYVMSARNENTFINGTNQNFSQVNPPDVNTPNQGTIDGMSYRWNYNASTDTGTITITSAPGSNTYTIRQDTTYMPFGGNAKTRSQLNFVKSNGAVVGGPLVTPLTKVNFVVNQEVAPNDARRNDLTDPMAYQQADNSFVTQLDYGQGPGSTIRYQERLTHNRGQWQGMKYDLVTNPTTGRATLYWVNKPGTSTISLNYQYDGNDGNQVINGISWTQQGTNQGGGVNFQRFQQLNKVDLVLVQKTGDNTFVNNTSLSLTRVTRRTR